MKNFGIFLAGVATGVVAALVLPKLLLGKKGDPGVAMKDEIIKTVNNPDGTITYYYKNGGVVIETTNKK